MRRARFKTVCPHFAWNGVIQIPCISDLCPCLPGALALQSEHVVFPFASFWDSGTLHREDWLVQSLLSSAAAPHPGPSCDGLSFEQSPFILLSGKCRRFFLCLFLLGKMINKVETVGKNAIFRIFSGFMVPLIIIGLILLVVVNVDCWYYCVVTTTVGSS